MDHSTSGFTADGSFGCGPRFLTWLISGTANVPTVACQPTGYGLPLYQHVCNVTTFWRHLLPATHLLLRQARAAACLPFLPFLPTDAPYSYLLPRCACALCSARCTLLHCHFLYHCTAGMVPTARGPCTRSPTHTPALPTQPHHHSPDMGVMMVCA